MSAMGEPTEADWLEGNDPRTEQDRRALRFPIRCRWNSDDGPAVRVLQLAFACGCAGGEVPSCADDVARLPVGTVASGVGFACKRCEASPAGYTVVGSRPLNEGDLPDD